MRELKIRSSEGLKNILILGLFSFVAIVYVIATNFSLFYVIGASIGLFFIYLYLFYAYLKRQEENFVLVVNEFGLLYKSKTKYAWNEISGFQIERHIRSRTKTLVEDIELVMIYKKSKKVRFRINAWDILPEDLLPVLLGYVKHHQSQM